MFHTLVLKLDDPAVLFAVQVILIQWLRVILEMTMAFTSIYSGNFKLMLKRLHQLKPMFRNAKLSNKENNIKKSAIWVQLYRIR